MLRTPERDSERDRLIEIIHVGFKNFIELDQFREKKV